MKLHRKQTEQLQPLEEQNVHVPAEAADPEGQEAAEPAEASGAASSYAREEEGAAAGDRQTDPKGESAADTEQGIPADGCGTPDDDTEGEAETEERLTEAPPAEEETAPAGEESSDEEEAAPAAEEAAPAKPAAEAEGREEGPQKSSARPSVLARRRRKHRKKNWFLRILIAAAVIAAVIVAGNLPYFQITQVAVIGNKTVSDKKILKLSELQEGDSIFFINPWLTGSRIKKNYYIESVHLQRHLPGTVEIIVKERKAAAQFVMLNKKKKKRYICVTEDGMVIGRSKKKKNVTMVINVTVTKAEKGAKIKVDDSSVYQKSMDLIRTAREGDLYFKRIFIKGSLVHAYIYDDLMCTGRYDNLISSIRGGTLKSVVYRLYQDDVSKGTINIGDNNYCSFTP